MTTFDVAAFKSQVSNTGFLQTNKYVVHITPNSRTQNMFINSPGVSANFRGMAEELQYRCVGATLPGMILRTADNNRMGLGIMEKMPFSAVYTDIDLTFLCDRYGAAYNFWYAWLNYIFASVGKETKKPVDTITNGKNSTGGNIATRNYYTTQYKDDYAAIVDVFVFDNSGEQRIAYKMYRAYPIAITDSPLSWGDNNNLLKITVKLNFNEWALDDGEVKISNSRQDSGPIGNLFDPTINPM
jgi:hypothetical protein